MDETELTALYNRVSREPLVPGGSSLVSHRLDCSDPERWEFRTSASYRGIITLFFFVGGAIVLGGICGGEGMSFERLFPLVFGAVFLLFGGVMLWNGARRARFDFGRGYYWRDRRLLRAGERNPLRDQLPLNQIAALQIVDEFCRRNRGNHYHSYELNLVKTDGSRLNVVEHGGKKAMMEDGRKLAEGLRVPLWGAMEEEAREEAESARERRIRKMIVWLGVICGSIFTLIGILLFWFLTLSPLLEYFAAQRWERVPAEVISCELVRSRSYSTKGGSTTVYRIAVSYRYEFEGRAYHNDRYDITRSNSSSNIDVEAMRAAVRRHPVGTHTFCWVNPENPAQALIDRELPLSYFLLRFWFPLPFVGFGLFCFIASLRRR